MKVGKLVVNKESELKLTLDKIYQASQKGEHFFSIVELMLNPVTITTAIHNIKSNKGSKTPGIDGKNIDDLLQMPYEEVIKLVQGAILNYKAAPVRRTYIEKRNSSKKRPLGIPVILDRVVQEITRIVLEPIVEAKFFGHSYGFRPNRSAHNAMARIHHIITFVGTNHVIEGDIKSYFDEIDHSRLMQALWTMGIRDKRVLSIISKMLKAGYMEDAKILKSELGTPQGGIISPLLANVYLHGLDKFISNMWHSHPKIKNYKNRTDGVRKLRKKGLKAAHIVRYADDFVIFTDDEKHANLLKKKVERYLKHRLKITLSPEKTLITNIRKRPMKFLGFCTKATDKVGARTGNNLPWSYPDPKRFTESIQKIRDKMRNVIFARDQLAKVEQLEKVNSAIIGVAGYYALNYDQLNLMDFRLWKAKTKAMLQTTGVNITELLDKYRCKTNKLSNRPNRHAKYEAKTYFLDHNNCKVGFTHARFSEPIEWEIAAEDLTPYTNEGRKKIASIKKRTEPLARAPLTDIEEIVRIMRNLKGNSKKKYTFEYWMNREYAYNRDHGNCRCCKTVLTVSNLHTHHIDPTLPPDKLNKVINLASVCKDCHVEIHRWIVGTKRKTARDKKIAGFAEKLTLRENVVK